MSLVRHQAVRAEEEGWRLDRWVRHHFPGVTHGALQKLLRTGQFRVDGKRVEAGARLVPGQDVRVPPLPDAEPQTALKPKMLRSEDARFIRSLVIHEDRSLIVLDKPAGLAVQGGTGTRRHVDGMLEALATGGERPRLVHRLDRDTSGLLVLARDSAVARELTHAFQQHRVRKLYWAILLRGPERDEGVIDVPLAKRGGAGNERMVADASGEGDARWARTGFRVLARAGKVAAWVALVPLTGRTHQLRAHCAAIAAPILGDLKYGGRETQPSGAPAGLMLHARELMLPRRGQPPLAVTADPPPSFRAGLAWLGMRVERLPGSSLRDWPA
jgi:23S rRNA pseudouridine955/2504/2580 synthase